MCELAKLRRYRADKRRIDVGKPIGSAGQYQDKHPLGALVEAALEAARPFGKPTRANRFMTFETEADAIKHWARMTDGILYEVELDAGAILHRADMRIVDRIGKLLREDPSADVSGLTKKYWDGVIETGPAELLCEPGVVVREIQVPREQKLKALGISQNEIGTESPFIEDMLEGGGRSE